MRARLALLTSLLVCNVSIVQLRSAHACSPGPCPQARLLPASGAVLPQNVPGFPFQPNREHASWGIEAGAELETVTLRDASGNVVATTLQSSSTVSAYGRVVVPAAPLALGSYTIEFLNACRADATTQSRSFTIGEAKPFPTDIGTLRAVRSTKGSVVVEGGGPCIETKTADSVAIEIDPSSSFAPFQAIAILSVFVDGKPWRGTVTDYSRRGYPDTFNPFEVYAVCNQANLGEAALRFGKHVVEVRAHIEGAPSDPVPAKLDIDLQCASEQGGSETTPPNGQGEDDATSPNAGSSGGGCSTIPVGKEAPAAFGVLSLMGLLAVRGRRRLRRWKGR